MDPKKLPKKTSGTDKPNHKRTRADIVPKGTAPEDFAPQFRALRTKKIEKRMEGNINAVFRAILFHSVPLNIFISELRSNRQISP